ncbi:hypothetical protein Tco_1068485 [Tanacetum coccineum]|uniref:Uncharacterized protein n=1 Tax=Tanacetum coccineum TaxID=301880 RepID=A0ABQ4YP35_9ASTR
MVINMVTWQENVGLLKIRNRGGDSNIITMNMETPTENALDALDELEGRLEQQLRKSILKTCIDAIHLRNSSDQVIDKFKTGLGYNAASSTAASPAVESFMNSFENV